MTPDQKTLLRGLLHADERGARQLTNWCETTDLDAVDGSSHKLLPLLFRSLSRRELAPRNIDRLRGVYRKSWYRNQQHVAAVSKALEALDAVGVDHAVAGGLPIALSAYDDLGARMLFTARLVVPTDDVARAVAMVARRGFTIQQPARAYGWGLPTILGTPAGGALDIRGSVYGPGWANAREEDLRARRLPLEADGLATATLDATDSIVQAAAAAASTRESWLQGLADVALMARVSDQGVDWTELVPRYAGSAMLVPLHEALSVLIEDIGVAVGAGAVGWHAEHKPRPGDRLRFWPHRNGRRLLRLAPWYRRGRRAQGQGDALSGFLPFAAAVYGVDSRADAVRRLRRRLGAWRR